MLLSLSLLTACHPDDSVAPLAPKHSAERAKPEPRTCQLTHFSWGSYGLGFTFKYDSQGRLTGYDANAGYHRLNYGGGYRYDSNGFLVGESLYVSPWMDRRSTTNTFQYNALGKLIPSPDLRQTVERDAVGRVVKLTKRNASNAIVYVITYSYLLLDRRIRQEVAYADGRRILMKWDALGENLIRVARTTSQGVTYSTELSHDKKPNPLKTLFNFKGWSHTDYLNLMAWHPFDSDEGFRGLYNGSSYSLYDLTSQNNPVKAVHTWADGSVSTTTFTYEYNANGYPTSAQIRYEPTNSPVTTESRRFTYQNCSPN